MVFRMKMIKEKTLDKFWVILFKIGYLLVAILSLSFLLNLPFESHLVLAITSSLAWFVSSLLFARIPDKLEKHQNLHFRWFWVGLIQVILAILFWIAIKPNTEFALWGRLINMMLGIYGFLTLYGALVSFFFPRIFQISSAPQSDPISTLPESIQEVMVEGRKRVGNPTALTLLIFVMIGAIGYILSIFIFHDTNLNIFFIPAGLGFLIGFTLNIVTTYKWQRWARQSGIPEEALKEAAKSAGLWWPQPGNKS